VSLTRSLRQQAKAFAGALATWKTDTPLGFDPCEVKTENDPVFTPNQRKQLHAIDPTIRERNVPCSEVRS
jgi:hypothetical protein